MFWVTGYAMIKSGEYQLPINSSLKSPNLISRNLLCVCRVSSHHTLFTEHLICVYLSQNCPHGRPTMRHLINITMLMDEETGNGNDVNDTDAAT